MFSVEGLRQFHRWTHESLGLVLDHLSAIPQSDYLRQVPGFGFGSLREQATHVLNCEAYWVRTLRGLTHFDRRPDEFSDAADLKRMQHEVGARTLEYLANMTDRELNDEKDVRLDDGNVLRCSPALVIHHALTHVFHHKGQMAAMCRLLGHPTKDTDLIRFN